MTDKNEHSKQYSSFSEWLEGGQTLNNFQRIHNVLRKDYDELLRITEEYKSSEKEFNALYRACIRSLFSIVEADMFGLNRLDEYENYNDREAFKEKFKETFKQVGRTFNKNEIVLKYLSSKLQSLLEFRDKRDELIHPKTAEHIHNATEADFSKLKTVFKDYTDFVNDIMTNSYLSVSINDFFR